MTRRTIILSIVGGVLAVTVIGGLVWYFFFRNTAPAPTVTTNTNTAIVVNQGVPVTTAAPTTNTNTAAPVANTNTTKLSTNDAAAALRVARVFIERYGTYSNRNNFENITNVQPFMTSGFQRESDAYIAKNATANKKETDPFYGITTTVLSLKADKYTEQKAAQVRVSTQRSETKGDTEQKTFTQDVLVNMVYSDGSWKVDQIAWQ